MSIDVLRRHNLPQDASGQTLAEKQAFLAELTQQPSAQSKD
jgi:hypothetical protein